jgi:hypothetical protein
MKCNNCRNFNIFSTVCNIFSHPVDPNYYCNSFSNTNNSAVSNTNTNEAVKHTNLYYLEQGIEFQIISIYNEVMDQKVEAATSEQAAIFKAQIFVEKLLEAGMSLSEAKAICGLTKDKGFNSLFS